LEAKNVYLNQKARFGFTIWSYLYF